MANRTCWAASIGGCSGTISGEHVISRSILRAALEFDRRLSLLHITIKRTLREQSIKSSTVNRLCVRHNSQLTDLDSEALRFFRAMLRAIDPKQPKEAFESSMPREERFDGRLLERWALKTFLNMCFHRGFTNDPESKGIVGLVNDTLINAVFQGTPLYGGQGVYLIGQPVPRGLNRVSAYTPIEVSVLEAVGSDSDPTQAGAKAPFIRAPVYMAVSIGPIQFVIVANITSMPQNDWTQMVESFARSGNMPPGGMYHPPLITLEWRDENVPDNALIREEVLPWKPKSESTEPGIIDCGQIPGRLILAAIINWHNPPTSAPAGFALNSWMKHAWEYLSDPAPTPAQLKALRDRFRQL
ncbi:MAG: hypothetical protein ACLPV2_18495 [Steroidobacteraceae bacterium]